MKELRRLKDLAQDSYFKTPHTNRWGKLQRLLESAIAGDTSPAMVQIAEIGSAKKFSTPLSVPSWELKVLSGECLVEYVG